MAFLVLSIKWKQLCAVRGVSGVSDEHDTDNYYDLLAAAGDVGVTGVIWLWDCMWDLLKKPTKLNQNSTVCSSHTFLQ